MPRTRTPAQHQSALLGLLALGACSGARPPDRAQPMGARLDGDALELTQGPARVRTRYNQGAYIQDFAVVALTADGRERAAFLGIDQTRDYSAGRYAQLNVIADNGVDPEVLWDARIGSRDDHARGVVGELTAAFLVDLDDDGRFELVELHRDEPYPRRPLGLLHVMRRGHARFEPANDLAARFTAPHAGGVAFIAPEVLPRGASVGAPAVLAYDPTGDVSIVLAYPVVEAAAMRLAVVAQRRDGNAAVVAERELGPAIGRAEALACPAALGRGVATWAAPWRAGTQAIAVVWPRDARHLVAQVIAWDGTNLGAAAREATDVGDCESGARAVGVAPPGDDPASAPALRVGNDPGRGTNP